MRELDVIMKDLTAAAKDIQSKKQTLDKLSVDQSNAFNALEEAKAKGNALKNEMSEFMNLLMPESSANNVRQSG